MKRFRDFLSVNEIGQAMVEMALVLPLLLAFVLGTIEFGNLYATKIEMNNLARQAVRMAVVSDPDIEEGMKTFTTLEGTMVGQAADLGMASATFTIVPTPATAEDEKITTVTATVSYSAPLLTGYILGTGEIELSSTASMRFEGDL